ncbi:hypothetical protein GCM10019998_19650 [Tetragenococcus solitarius]|uniref:Uncharacterized protein n=1 Tax=Tetragenococcus solitarius TaxID=71453 RepID=A0ABP6KV32_9ENTE
MVQFYKAIIENDTVKKVDRRFLGTRFYMVYPTFKFSSYLEILYYKQLTYFISAKHFAMDKDREENPNRFPMFAKIGNVSRFHSLRSKRQGID